MAFVTEPTLIVALIEVAVGLWLLTKAADEFVEGAANVASALSISPVVIGAVIVGFGTSAPELLVSSLAAWNGDLDLGVGNVVGSNVANLTLVLGAAALIVALSVAPSVLAREAPLSLLAVLLFAFFTTGGLERWEGIILLGALVGVMSWIVGGGRVDHAESHSLDDGGPLSSQALRTGGGLLGTIAGAQLLVWGASAIAEMAGISGGFVGFTLVAIGTSLPELVTAVAAARKNETEIILGNLLGSNIFNSLAVGGAIATIRPGVVEDEELATVGVVGMALVAFIAWAFMVSRKRVHRIEAVVLLAVWLGSVVLMARGATEPIVVALGFGA